MTKLLSYHSDPLVKQKYVERFAKHRAADEVIQGQGFDNGRGCFVGCTLDDYDHSRFPIELGWPEWLARLADVIFEGLPKTKAAQFGADILNSVPVGVNLEPVRARFLLIVQRRNLVRLESNNKPYAIQCRAAIQKVINLLESKTSSESESESAARAAWAVAAESGSARAWVESAAWAAWAAESGSAARAAARSARSAKEYQTQRDDLLKLLRECNDV